MELQPHFEVIHSNDMDVLARICAGIISRHPLEDPFSSEKILVMNFGMRTYLNQKLAVLNGISAHCDFLPLWTFIWEIFRAVNPGADRINRFSRDYLPWTLLGLKDKWGSAAGTDGKLFRRMREYIAGDQDGSRAWELCSRVADTFDQYQMYRPDWIGAWNKFTDADFEQYVRSTGTKGSGGPVRQWINRSAANAWSDPARGRDARAPGRRRVFEENIWQARLWSLLRGRLDPKDYRGGPLEGEAAATALMDRSQVLEELCRMFFESGGGGLQGIPERVFIFGVSALPEQVLVFLQALARHSCVYLMFLNPCREYWGDLNSGAAEDFKKFRRCCRGQSRDLTARRGRTIRDFGCSPGTGSASAGTAYDDEGHRVEGNPLLLGLGRQGMDNLTMLLGLNPAPDFTGAFVERSGDNMLEELQNRLLRLDEGDGKKYLIKDDDASLQIRSCHTRLREVEVLRDALLSLFAAAREQGEVLLPRDLLVMVPNIEEYAADFEAVFGGVPRESPAYIPYAVADRSSACASGAAEAVLKLLGIGVRRFSVSLFSDLLSVPLIATRFGIRQDEVDVLCGWCAGAGIHWALDDRDTRKLSEFPLPWTFEHGIERMLDGYMQGNDYGGAYPEIEGHEDAQLLGKFWNFIEALRELRDDFYPRLQLDGAGEEAGRAGAEGTADAAGKAGAAGAATAQGTEAPEGAKTAADTPGGDGAEGTDGADTAEEEGAEGADGAETAENTPGSDGAEAAGAESGERCSAHEWAQRLKERILNRFLAPESEEEHQDLQELCHLIGGMEDISRQLKQPPEITLPVFRSMLEEALGRVSGRSHYLESAMSVCSLIPMRTVPFKHIFILGLNDGEFPRRSRGPAFNLMRLQGFFRRGDRSRAIDDRYLFLEALLAADRSIYFSYTGESPSDQRELNPSPVLAELLDYLEDNFEVPGCNDPEHAREAVRTRLLRREHLSASDPDNFRDHLERGTVQVRASYDAGSFIAPGGQMVPREYPGMLRNWGICPGEKLNCSTEDLCRFFTSPSRFFLRQNFRINLKSSADTENTDDEIFIPDRLKRGRLLGEFFRCRDEQELEQRARQLELSGAFPAGVFAARLHTELLESLDNVRRALELRGIGGQGQSLTYDSGERLIADEVSGCLVRMRFSGRTAVPAVIFQPYSRIKVTGTGSGTAGKRAGKGSARGARKGSAKDTAGGAATGSGRDGAVLSFSAPQRILEALVKSLAATLAGAEDGSVYLCDCSAALLRFRGFVSEAEALEVLDKVLGFYLSGLLRPFPCSCRMLAPKQSDGEGFEYDPEAVLLFGSPEQITDKNLHNPGLNAEFERFRQLYARAAARVEVLK